MSPSLAGAVPHTTTSVSKSRITPSPGSSGDESSGLLNRSPNDATSDRPAACESEPPPLVPTLSRKCPELAEVVAAWPRLEAAVREAIVDMARKLKR